jgi:hypothetical protein
VIKIRDVEIMATPLIFVPRTSAQKATDAEHLFTVEAYGSPRKVWIEDGHVFVESYDGKVVSMTPEVAIKLGRTISEAGTDSLINRVMEESENSSAKTPASDAVIDRVG